MAASKRVREKLMEFKDARAEFRGIPGTLSEQHPNLSAAGIQPATTARLPVWSKAASASAALLDESLLALGAYGRQQHDQQQGGATNSRPAESGATRQCWSTS